MTNTKWLLVGLILAATVAPVSARAAEWVANTGGSWANPSNWDAFPLSGDDVIIDNNDDAGMASGSSVTLDGDRTVGTLTLDFHDNDAVSSGSYTFTLESGTPAGSTLTANSVVMDFYKARADRYSATMAIDAAVHFAAQNGLIDLNYASGGGYGQNPHLDFNGPVTADASVTQLKISGSGIRFTGAVNLPDTVLAAQGNATWEINASNIAIGGVSYTGYTSTNDFYGDNNDYGALNIAGGNNHRFNVYGQNGSFDSLYTRTGNGNIYLHASSNTVTGNADLRDGRFYMDIVSESQFARLVVNGTTGISYPDWGASPELYINLDGGFDLLPGMAFGMFDLLGGLNLANNRTGLFGNLAEGDVVLTDPDTGEDLFITYQGSIVDGSVESLTGGQDIVLYTVPEPASLTLLGIAGLAVLRRRRRR